MVLWISAGAAIAAAAVAWWALKAQRRRTTLDFICRYEIHTTGDWPKVTLVAVRAIDNKDIWEPLVELKAQLPEGIPADADRVHSDHLEVGALGSGGTADKLALLKWLNHWEIVGIGVRDKIIDRDLYIKWYGPLYKQYWERSKPCVESFRKREGAPDLFAEFQKFAESI